MARLVDRLYKHSIFKILVIVFLICILAVGPALAQRSPRARTRTFDTPPPRREHSYKPWPWFIAFILLGLACYPAFKNSKRELNE